MLAGCLPAGLAATASTALVDERSLADAARDLRIAAAIEEALFETRVDDLYRAVNVDVIEGRVLLTGVVPDLARADEAAAIAWKVDGVKRVINEVRPGDLSVIDSARDRWIAAQLRARLAGDGAVHDFNYAIATVGGVVHVMGIARDPAERARVEAHVRDIAYVRGAAMHIVPRDDPSRGGGS